MREFDCIVNEIEEHLLESLLIQTVALIVWEFNLGFYTNVTHDCFRHHQFDYFKDALLDVDRL